MAGDDGFRLLPKLQRWGCMVVSKTWVIVFCGPARGTGGDAREGGGRRASCAPPRFTTPAPPCPPTLSLAPSHGGRVEPKNVAN